MVGVAGYFVLVGCWVLLTSCCLLVIAGCVLLLICFAGLEVGFIDCWGLLVG